MKKIQYMKLDADDIMEILLEYYQEQFEDSECAKGMFLGTPDHELRFVAAFASMENDEICKVDLRNVDKNMDYNGEHSFLRKNPNFYTK